MKKAHYKKLESGKLACSIFDNEVVNDTNEWDLIIEVEDMPDTHIDYLDLVDGELVTLDDSLLESQRQEKWDECKALRETKKHENFTYRDWIFEARETDVSNIERKLRVIENGDIVNWLDVDNSPHPFSDGDLHDMLKIIVDRGEMLYVKSWEVREIINNSDAPHLLNVESLYEDAINE